MLYRCMNKSYGITKKDASNFVCWGFTEVYAMQTCTGKKDFGKRKAWREKLCMQMHGGFLKTVAGA